MASLEKTQTFLETVDLTGQQPVFGKKVVEKTIEIHNLDGCSPTESSMTSTSIIDRRLKYVDYFV